ncbi:hypothetical protein ABKN59_011944 [Abortiporus biennis]
MTPTLCATITLDQDILLQDIHSALPSDPMYIQFTDSPNGSDKWTLTKDGSLRYHGLIYVPDSNDLRLRILRFKYDHILAGHMGQNKTIDLIRQEYDWPGLCNFVKEYCKSCVTCMHTKPQQHKPYGTLQQLPVPTRPWDSISMDFIEQLPNSSGYDAILVIVDRLSKQGIFIPTHTTCTSEQLVELFVIHVFSKHGVPNHVTCDRGSKFVSQFFRSVGEALSMRIHFTSSYYPEGDGQTEHTN